MVWHAGALTYNYYYYTWKAIATCYIHRHYEMLYITQYYGCIALFLNWEGGGLKFYGLKSTIIIYCSIMVHYFGYVSIITWIKVDLFSTVFTMPIHNVYLLLIPPLHPCILIIISLVLWSIGNHKKWKKVKSIKALCYSHG